MSNIKTYTGTKVVLAEPMNRADYNTYRGWEVPADEDPKDEGYLVEYQDGGKANMPDRKGYVSWSPKVVFERTYTEVSGDFKDRVRAEQADLQGKTIKLTEFVGGDIYAGLYYFEQELLTRQLGAMQTYLAALNSRIALF